MNSILLKQGIKYAAWGAFMLFLSSVFAYCFLYLGWRASHPAYTSEVDPDSVAILGFLSLAGLLAGISFITMGLLRVLRGIYGRT